MDTRPATQPATKSTRSKKWHSQLTWSLFWLGGVGVFSYIHAGSLPEANLLTVAAIIGAYMALNIGANDVANNVGPAIGSGAMTMTMAIVIAAILYFTIRGMLVS